MADRTDAPTGGKRRETGEHSDGALDATGTYETASGVVLYDTEKPLAWVQADNAVTLDEMT
jgi:hypothetical protein